MCPSVHPDVLLPLTPSAILLRIAASSSARPTSEHPILETKVEVTGTLEHATQFEGPGDRLFAEEKVAHLHGVTNDPCHEDGHSETPARAGTMIGNDLREGKRGFDGEADAAEETDVGFRLGDGSQVDHGQNGYEVCQEQPVSVATLCQPFP